MAGFLGEPTVLVDVTGGPAAIAAGVRAAAEELGCDLVVFADVGGDAIADGSEPGLASPLCDAVMLAGARLLAPETPVIGAVFGVGCDGELTAAEVLARIAAFARADGWLGTWGMSRAIADELLAATEVIPTEASLQAVRCARGETGEVWIRDGRRTSSSRPWAPSRSSSTRSRGPGACRWPTRSPAPPTSRPRARRSRRSASAPSSTTSATAPRRRAG